MKQPKSFYVNLAALALSGTSVFFQMKDRNTTNSAAEILREYRRIQMAKVENLKEVSRMARERAELTEENLQFAADKSELARETAELAERKADFALQQARQAQQAQQAQQTQSTHPEFPDVSKPDLPEIEKSSLFDFISDILDSFWDFFMSLDLLHNAALFNILLITSIVLGLVDIFVLYLSDFYISKFNLETRYPKLAKYLKARQILVKGSLFVHTLCLLLVLLLGLLLNAAILFYV